MKRLLILAMLAAPGAEGAYKCKDEKGVTHIGDTPPAQCATVPLYEISRSGAVIRKIDPTLTPEQAQAKQEEEVRAREAAKAADEQRRKDLALLATYSSEKDIDTSRDVNLQPIQGRLKSAQDRIVAVEKRQQVLDEEMEFYKAGKSKDPKKVREAPLQLRTDVERARNEKAALTAAVANYEKEIAEIRARFEADKKRWVELKQLHRDGKLDLRDPKAIEAAKKVDPSKQPAKKYNLYLAPGS